MYIHSLLLKSRRTTEPPPVVIRMYRKEELVVIDNLILSAAIVNTASPAASGRTFMYANKPMYLTTRWSVFPKVLEVNNLDAVDGKRKPLKTHQLDGGY